MNEPPFGPFERQWSNDSQPTGLLVLAGALLIGGGLLAGILFKAFDRQGNSGPPLGIDSSGVVTYDSSSGLELHQPMAIATDGRRLFVADSLAGQVLVLDL